MKISSIEHVGKLPVYDITVEDVHHYVLENGVVTHNTSMTYSANQIFVITKSQEKGSDGELDGWKFTINIHKSRGVKEKSKLPFQVMYESGIQRYSGIFDIALEGGFIQKPKQGWYAYVDQETGEVSDKNFRAKEFDELYVEKILSDQKFKEYVKKEYKLSTMIVDLDEPMLASDDEDDSE